jgi:hypothetical protein
MTSSFGLCDLLELSGMDIEIVTPTSRCTEQGVSPRNPICRTQQAGEQAHTHYSTADASLWMS